MLYSNRSAVTVGEDGTEMGLLRYLQSVDSIKRARVAQTAV